MTKLLFKSLLLLSLALSLTAYSQKQIIPQFVGGIDQQKAKICMQQTKQSPCKLKNMLADYQACIKKVLLRTPDCQQSLAFFKKTSGGIFNRVRHYQNIDIILADYVYVADQGTGYFLVMKNGQFLALPLNIAKKTLKKVPGYTTIAKKFPRVDTWQILDFPQAVSISPQRYRLVFTQQLKDGCNACALAGTAKVAYDFSADGKQFFGVSVIRLIPKP
jgi:hypothetical protein